MLVQLSMGNKVFETKGKTFEGFFYISYNKYKDRLKKEKV